MKRSTNDFNRICIVDTVYSLFLYQLVSDESELEKTFYFYSDGINRNITKKLAGYYFSSKRNKCNLYFRLFLFRIMIKLRWRFIKNAAVYGQDHLYISGSLIGKKSYTAIEDGLSNYVEHDTDALRKSKIKHIVNKFSVNFIENEYGNNSQCIQIILTRHTKGNTVNKEKIINIFDLWKNSDSNKKNIILNLFDLQTAELKTLTQKKIILFTQPIDSVGIMTEQEKIDVYKKIMQHYKKEDVVIKPHPREKTDYKIYFPDIYVFDKVLPAELLNCVDVRFEKAVTIFSSAVFNFPYNIKVDWISSKISSKLFERYGYLNVDSFSNNDVLNCEIDVINL